MVETPNLFGSLKIDNWFKLLIYLGGVMFLLSLFIPVKVANQLFICQLGAATFIGGFLIWILYTLSGIAADGVEVLAHKNNWNTYGGLIVFAYWSMVTLILIVLYFSYWSKLLNLT